MSEKKDYPRIISNTSTGYGYRYASLADMARQGVPVPKMRTVETERGEYIEYWDEQANEWQQGARVVIPSMKGANEAQQYGSAVTYARRVTTALAAGIVTDDDTQLERQPPQQQAQPASAGQPDWPDPTGGYNNR